MSMDESKPLKGDQVTISFEGRLVSGGALNGQIVEKESSFNFTLGADKSSKCFDLAISEMSLDQEVGVTCTSDHQLDPKTTKQPMSNLKNRISLQYSI